MPHYIQTYFYFRCHRYTSRQPILFNGIYGRRGDHIAVDIPITSIHCNLFRSLHILQVAECHRMQQISLCSADASLFHVPVMVQNTFNTCRATSAISGLLVYVLIYRPHYFLRKGHSRASVKRVFAEHSIYSTTFWQTTRGNIKWHLQKLLLWNHASQMAWLHTYCS